MRPVRLFLLLLLLLAGFPAQAVREYSGITPSGAVYRIAVPEGWQAGDRLVLYQNDLSFETRLAPNLGPLLPVQLEQGYAVAASGYRQPGWSGFSAVADNLELLERVVIDLGQPGQVIAYGQAMGGHAALQLALAPEQPLAAALPLCPIIRADQFWQAALDLRLLYGHTCDQVDGAALPAAADLPWLLPAHQISAPGLEQVVLRANRCLGLNLPDWQRSAGQQARLQQLQAASGIDDDGQLLLGLVHASLGLADVVRGPDKLAGRLAFGNAGARYGHGADAGIARIAQDPFAALDFRLSSGLAPLPPAWSLSGDRPPARVLALHTAGDQLLPASHARWLAGQLPAAALRQAWVAPAGTGHCLISEVEMRAAWEGLRAWLDRQQAPDAGRLQAICQALGEGGLAEGRCRLAAGPPAAAAPTLPVTRPQPASVDARYSGLWHDPQRPGEGWLLQVLDPHIALLHGFTASAAGEPGDQLWLSALGRIDGDGIAFDRVERVHGRGFGTAFQADRVRVEDWGWAQIVFSGCGHGELRFQGPPGHDQERRLLRQEMALGGHDCAAEEDPASLAASAPALGAVSGSFYDPAAPGQGLVIAATDDGQLSVLLFGHARAGHPVWLQTRGRLDASGRVQLEPAVQPRGTRFGRAGTDRRDQPPWGTLDLRLAGCDTVHLHYQAHATDDGSGALVLERLTWPLATGTCPLPDQ